MLIFGQTEGLQQSEVTEIYPTRFTNTAYVTGTYVGATTNVNVIVVSAKTDSTKVTFNKTGVEGTIAGPISYIASGRWK